MPLEADGHVLDDFRQGVVAMDPTILIGARKGPGSLDFALLADIGYQIDVFEKQGELFELTTSGDDAPVFGSQIADTIDGLAGDDVIQGGDGDDFLSGGTGSDLLFGQSGEDILDGGADDDQLQGGSGYDTYVFDGIRGNDIVFDPDPTGKIEFVGYLESDVDISPSGESLRFSAGGNSVGLWIIWPSGRAT